MTMQHIHRRTTDNVWICGRCGWVVDDQDTPWRATCETCRQRDAERLASTPQQALAWKPVMVGDLVEQALTAVGITKSLVERITRTTGKHGGCGCSARKRWLNARGLQFQRQLRGTLLAVQRFYFG